MNNVILLGITSLLTDFSSEMVLPILPFFIKSIGGAGVAIGLIFGIGDAVAALLRVFSGYWADRTRKYKLFTFLGYLASAGAKFGYVGALQWPDIAIVRPVERLGKGFRDAPRDAIISESAPEGERGRAFGIQRAMDSAGAILGSVAVLVLYVYLDVPFRTIFLISACIGVAATIPVLLVKVPPILRGATHAVRLGRIPAAAKKFIAIATVFALANFSVAFFILKSQESSGNLPYKEALALSLLAYIVFNIVDTVFSGPAGALSDRFGRRRIILIGYGLFMLVCLGFALFSSPAALVALFGLYGLFKAFIDASQRAMVSDLSPYEVRGTALGAFETATGLAAIPAGLAAGLLYNMSPAYPFLYGMGMSLIAAVALWTAIRTR